MNDHDSIREEEIPAAQAAPVEVVAEQVSAESPAAAAGEATEP